MPVIVKINSPEGQQTGVWEITESESQLLDKVKLSARETEVLRSFKSEGRRMQWLAVRALLQEFRPVCPVISYKENGKPYFEDHHEEISISHSGKLAAIAIHKGSAPGVDAEEIHPRINKIAERFTNSTEQAYLQGSILVRQLCTIWAAKEVLYKIHPVGFLSFKENLFISPFDLKEEGHLMGTIKKDGKTTEHSLAYKVIGNYILVYTDWN